MSNSDINFGDVNDNDDLFSDIGGDDDLFSEDSNDLFASEEEAQGNISEDAWKVVIVDDEAEVHTVTKFALSDYTYKNRRLHFIDAYSGKEAREILAKEENVALILLDVVMENNHAGLEVVEYIRNKLDNHFIRIVLRTGQPGQAPEEDVIIKYDINDYKNKTELTDRKLFTTMTTGLRSYADIMEIESFRQNLEDKVIERTKEIAQKNEELRDKNQQIISSINYAQRIQKAMLPYIENIDKAFGHSFILFKPRDIVSGDFYWFSQKGNEYVISAIDCTGHGVPGAFMSMIGDAYLNQIVNIQAITSPDLILNELHKKIRTALKQDETQNRDGMDMAICSYNADTKILSFAGAKNPMVYIQNNEVKQVKGDRTPIGGVQKEAERIFTKYDFQIDQVTTVYLFSDGFPDQFGGELNKKFMIRNFRNLLLEIHQQSFAEQKEILENTIEDWMKSGNMNQTDDILVVGFKIEP